MDYIKQETLKEIILNYKTCNKCNIVKNIIDFEKNRKQCKICVKERKDNYYQTHKDVYKNKYYKYEKKIINQGLIL